MPPRGRNRRKRKSTSQTGCTLERLSLSSYSSVSSSQSSSLSLTSSKNFWEQHIRCQLLVFLYADVIPLVVAYAASIHFSFLRSIGQKGDADGELDRPYGMCLHGDELFVADTFNARVQVFHQNTGRLLRQWGNTG